MGPLPQERILVKKLEYILTCRARDRAHQSFDQLWMPPGRMSRSVAYAWLANQMGVSRDKAHFSLFSVSECASASQHVEKTLKLYRWKA